MRNGFDHPVQTTGGAKFVVVGIITSGIYALDISVGNRNNIYSRKRSSVGLFVVSTAFKPHDQVLILTLCAINDIQSLPSSFPTMDQLWLRSCDEDDTQDDSHSPSIGVECEPGE
ncbi:hypothetical protein TNCV_21671 [Trichonephila clavipes]|nr:hypothetical protein TNCV_21671 [Trichonephila clavipes]